MARVRQPKTPKKTDLDRRRRRNAQTPGAVQGQEVRAAAGRGADPAVLQQPARLVPASMSVAAPPADHARYGDIPRQAHIEIVTDREQSRELDREPIEPCDRLRAEVRSAALWLCTPRHPACGETRVEGVGCGRGDIVTMARQADEDGDAIDEDVTAVLVGG